MNAVAAVCLAMVASTIVTPSRAEPSPFWRAELLSRADVDGPRVRLGDLVRLRETAGPASVGGPLSISAIEAMDLGAAPRFGDELRLDRKRIEAWLRRATPQQPPFAREGADTVSIARLGRDVPAEDICRAATEAVRATLTRPDLEVRAVAQCPETASRVPHGRDISLRARPPIDDAWPARRIVVPVELWTDGQHARTVAVPVKVEALGLAWVAREDLAAQQPLDGDAAPPMDALTVDLAGLNAAPLTARTPLEGLRLRRPVLKGQVLTATHVEARPIVRRGQPVTVRAQSGAISLETTGEALQDGVNGKSVLVRMGSRAGAPLLARVVGPNQVQLQP